MPLSREFIDLIHDITLDPENYPPGQTAKLKHGAVWYYWGEDLVAKLDPIYGEPHFAIRIENIWGRRFGFNRVRVDDIFEGISGDRIIRLAHGCKGIYKFNINFPTTPQDASPDHKAQIAYVIEQVVDSFSD